MAKKSNMMKYKLKVIEVEVNEIEKCLNGFDL